jgi:PST family polysaccharide transporter
MTNLSLETNSSQHFQTEHLRQDLKGRSVRGGLVTVLTQLGKVVVNLGALAVLARLLTPQDFGLIAMVATVTNLVTLIKDMGLSMATIQKPEINHRQVSTLFWVNIGFSGVLALIVAAVAPMISWFFNEPRLTLVTLSLSACLGLSGLMIQHEALLRRQMRFKDLSLVQIASMALGAVAAILAAWGGAGYWSLVIKQLIEQMVSIVGVWWLCNWRPGRPGKLTEIYDMLFFGSNVMGYNFINYFARNLDNVLIGWRWGATPLGLYDRAYQLFLLPIQQFNTPFASVANPTLSRLLDSPEQYRQAYLRVLDKLALLSMPFIVFTIAAADWIFDLAFGSQWQDASRIFAWLGFTALMQPICNSTGWLFMTQGRTWPMLQWGMISSLWSVLSIIIGLPWGAEGVAASYSILGLLRTPVLFWFVCREGPIHAIDLYRAITPATLASICSLIILFGFRHGSGIVNPWLGTGLTALITIAVTMTVLMLLPAGRKSLLDLLSLSRLVSHRFGNNPS